MAGTNTSLTIDKAVIGSLWFITDTNESVVCNIIGIPFRITSVSWPFLTIELATNEGKHNILDTRLVVIQRTNREYFDKVAGIDSNPTIPATKNCSQDAIDKAIQNGYSSRHDLGGWADANY